MQYLVNYFYEKTLCIGTVPLHRLDSIFRAQVKIWDVATAQCTATWQQTKGCLVHSLAVLSPIFLLTGQSDSDGNTVRVWYYVHSNSKLERTFF